MRIDKRGSFTVEAAFAVPVFVFAITAFILLFKILLMQVQIQEALTEASKEVSQLAYLNEKPRGEDEQKQLAIPKVTSEQYEIERFFADKNKYSMLLRGPVVYKDLVPSSVDIDDEIDLKANYTIQIPLPLLKKIAIPLTQRVKHREFIGSKYLLSLKRGESGEDGKSSRYVYVTETGTVYHLTLECSALKLKISQCRMDEVCKMRNQSGGKYKKCEKCCKQTETLYNVYISEDGDRYHSILECSGLKRTIHRVPLEEAEEKMRACYRCGSEG